MNMLKSCPGTQALGKFELIKMDYMESFVWFFYIGVTKGPGEGGKVIRVEKFRQKAGPNHLFRPMEETQKCCQVRLSHQMPAAKVYISFPL